MTLTNQRPTFRRALIKTLLIPMLLGALTAGVFFMQVRYLTSMAGRVEHSDSVISSANQVGYLFMEARIRWQRIHLQGFKKDLERFEPIEREVIHHIEQLRVLVRDNPSQLIFTQKMLRRMKMWEAIGDRQLGTVQTSNPQEIIKIILERDALSFGFREALDSFIESEERIRTDRIQKSEEATRLVTRLGIGMASLIGIIIGFFTRFQLLSLADSYNDALAAVELQAQTLESANKAKNLFLANMSHEMRTPLSAIIGFTKMALAPYQTSTDIHASLEAIQRNSEHLHKIINDLLDISRIEAGQIQIVKTKALLSNLVDEIRINFRKLFQEKNIPFRITFSPEVPDVILTDPIRLGQILNNLIGNALKFTQRGDVSLDVDFELGPSPTAPGKLLFRISDTGVGIPNNKVAQLFQPFVQVDNSEHRRFTGTGLGLAISRQLARALGGDLILERSQLNIGSTFRLTIPTEHSLTPYNDTSRTLEEKNAFATKNQPPLLGIRILAAEDSPDLALLIEKFLKRNGAQIELVRDGIEVIASAINGSFDIILMDIHMPLKDGITATKELRDQGYKKPIIALTAHASEEERQRCLEAGCDDHVPKPMDPVLLISKVRKFYLAQKTFSSSQKAELETPHLLRDEGKT